MCSFSMSVRCFSRFRDVRRQVTLFIRSLGFINEVAGFGCSVLNNWRCQESFYSEHSCEHHSVVLLNPVNRQLGDRRQTLMYYLTDLAKSYCFFWPKLHPSICSFCTFLLIDRVGNITAHLELYKCCNECVKNYKGVTRILKSIDMLRWIRK